MSNRLKSTIFSALAFGILMGLFFALLHQTWHAFFFGPVAGIVFGVLLYFFVNSKIVAEQTKIENTEEKNIIMTSDANLMDNKGGAGGKLYLLEDKIHFKSHSFNISKHEIIIPLQEISKVQVYNTIGIIPNGLLIINKAGKQHKFAVHNRKNWKQEIEKIIKDF